MSEPQKRTPPRLIEVVERIDLSPHLTQIVFGGESLAGFGPSFPAAHIKLFFPREHQTTPLLPSLSAEGRPIWPAAPDKPIVRTYSTRAHDVSRGTLTVEFVVHEPDGPASQWARSARPRMRVGLAGPGGPNPMLKPADWYLLAGDLSALPAMAALLETVPADAPSLVFVQLDDERDMRALRLPRRAKLHWEICRESKRDVLVDAVTSAAFPQGKPQIWLAGENTQVVALRDRLLDRYPEARANMYAVPYWKRRETEEQYHLERHRIMDELSGP